MIFTTSALQLGHETQATWLTLWAATQFVLRLDHVTRHFYIAIPHFADNSEASQRRRIWPSMETTIFDTLCEAYTNFYNLSERLAVDVVTKIKGRGYLQAVYYKENVWHQNFQTDESGYTQDTSTYWPKGEDLGRYDRFILKERWNVYMLTRTHLQQEMTATAPWNLTSWNSTTDTLGYINNSDSMAQQIFSQHNFKYTK
jgi:hypothetical protein